MVKGLTEKQKANLPKALQKAIMAKRRGKAPAKSDMKEKPPKGANMKKLTPAQEERLKEHANHHSVKHMNMMKKDMRMGMSFTAAHKKAQKAVGK